MQREYLTLSELHTLAKTPAKCEVLKKASLFAALTGLRFSNIRKLIWSEIQHSKEQGFYIRFRQKKTKDAETLPISEEAYLLLGERGNGSEKVFLDLCRWHCEYYLSGWITDAGIDRDITFHCFRHSFAVNQLILGTDIYTVSKLLGHKRLETTEIYARVVDARKREAVGKITLR